MSIKDNYLNPIELAGLYHAAINGTVSKNDLSETERLQLLKFAKDKKQDIEFGIFETINLGKLTPSMYNYDLAAFIEKQSVIPQLVIDLLSETNSKPNPNNPTKLEFTSRKIKEFVLELSEFGGEQNPVTYLNAWLEKLKSIGIKTFEYECLITIYQAFKENASLFWNNSHNEKIKDWLISNNAGIHPIDFGNVWDEASRIKRIYTNKNSVYKAEFDKLKIESEDIESIDEKIIFWAKKLAEFKQNLSYDIINVSGMVSSHTKVNAPLFLDRLIEEEIKYLNTIRDLNAKSVKYETMETKAAKLKHDLDKHGFFNLPMVKQLLEPNKQKLVELIRANKMPYGIAMFDYLGFCKFLFEEHGTWYKADKILSQLYNEKAKDGTSAKHNRRSLVKPLIRYKAGNYKETVKTDYQKLK